MKNLFFISFLLLCITAQSQSIPNNGFENWTACPTTQEPIPFQTSNIYSSLFGGGFNVEQTTDAHGGNYAAYAHVDASGQIPGLISLGMDLMSGATTPLTFTGTPDSISFWAKHTISDIEFGSVVIILYQDGVEVGFGGVTFNDVVQEYTYYSAAVDITPGTTPNGMSLTITSGDDPSLGGELYIDDIHLIYNTGTGDDIPGGDFENWNIANAECLDGWFTTNGFTSPNLSVTQGAPHSGSYSARVTNQPTSFGGGALGYIILGDPESDFCSDASLQMEQGQAASVISGFYNYTAGNANEMATLYLYYSAINDLGGCDSIYELYQYMPPTTDWTQFQINIPSNIIDQWSSGQAPDHLTIGFVSTMVSNETEPNGDPNSVLLVDDLELTYTTVGVAEMGVSSVHAYPNPFNDQLNIQLPGNTKAEIKLIDALGKIALTANSNGGNTTLNTNTLPAGIYTLLFNDGTSITTQQVILQR
jgi:hypothetical protein